MIFDSEYAQVSFEIEKLIENSVDPLFTKYLNETYEELKKAPANAMVYRQKLIANYSVYSQRMGNKVDRFYFHSIYGDADTPQILNPYGNNIEINSPYSNDIDVQGRSGTNTTNINTSNSISYGNSSNNTILNSQTQNVVQTQSVFPTQNIPQTQNVTTTAFDNPIQYSEQISNNKPKTGRVVFKTFCFIVGLWLLYFVLTLVSVSIFTNVIAVYSESTEEMIAMYVVYFILFAAFLFGGTVGLSFLIETKTSSNWCMAWAIILAIWNMNTNHWIGCILTIIVFSCTIIPIRIRRKRLLY